MRHALPVILVAVGLAGLSPAARAQERPASAVAPVASHGLVLAVNGLG